MAASAAFERQGLCGRPPACRGVPGQCPAGQSRADCPPCCAWPPRAAWRRPAATPAKAEFWYRQVADRFAKTQLCRPGAIQAGRDGRPAEEARRGDRPLQAMSGGVARRPIWLPGPSYGLAAACFAKEDDKGATAALDELLAAKPEHGLGCAGPLSPRAGASAAEATRCGGQGPGGASWSASRRPTRRPMPATRWLCAASP